LVFFIVLLHFTINNHLLQYYHDNRACSASFFAISLPVAASFSFPVSFWRPFSFSRPFSLSRAHPSFSRPYFHLATRRFHPHPPSVLESIRNPTAATRRITPQLAPSFVLFLGTASAA